MKSIRNHSAYEFEILSRIESYQNITQRGLSEELGIALGLTNLLIRKLVKRGWIELVRKRPNGIRYFLTPAGVAVKTHQTKNYLERTVHLYGQTREVIRRRLETLSAEWPTTAWPTNSPGVEASPTKRIVFYGAGEIAEIGYVSLQITDLELVGVIDDNPGKEFFGMRVYPPSCLTSAGLNGQPFGCAVIMSFKSAPRLCKNLEKLGFPEERIFPLA